MLSRVIRGARAAAAVPCQFAQPEPPPAEQAPADNTELLRKVRADALEEGRREGERMARAAVTPVLERLHASISGIMALGPDLRRQIEKDAVELALRIARRILRRELSIDHGALNALARVAFERISSADQWNLTVHPDFAEGVAGMLPAGSSANLQIRIDANCAPGTFLLRSENAEIDASIESQLEEIGRGLTDRVK